MFHFIVGVQSDVLEFCAANKSNSKRVDATKPISLPLDHKVSEKKKIS